MTRFYAMRDRWNGAREGLPVFHRWGIYDRTKTPAERLIRTGMTKARAESIAHGLNIGTVRLDQVVPQ